MNPDGKEKTESTREIVCVVIGGFLMFVNSNFLNTWGNMSVYILSYCYKHFGTFLNTDSTWISGMYLSGLGVGVLLGGHLTFWSRNKILFISILIGNSGLISWYFTLKYGLEPLMFIGFFIFSVSAGVPYGIIPKVLGTLPGDRKGLYISIALSGAPFGPFVFNIFISLFVNPNNLTPDKNIGNIYVFYQPHLIKNVPFVFLVLGLLSFGLQTLGLILINCKQPVKEPNEEVTNTHGSNTTETTKDVHHVQNSNTTSNDNKERKEFTPKQMMRTVLFYALWFAFGVQFLPRILLNNYYKLFGQIYISDDHFLTALGSSKALTGSISRLVWGLALDKMSSEFALIIIYTVYVLTCLFWYFTPMVNKYLYFITAHVLGCAASCAATTHVTAVLALFGVDNVDKNYGIIFTSGIVASLVTPLLFETILVHFGWFSIFAATGMVSALAVCLMMLAFSKLIA